MSEALHSIGQFAKAVRLSVKALRRYDADGLLEPAHVDPETGYRYYAQSQAREAVTIGLLRKLDVPLAVIRALLKADGDRAALLGTERERLQRELANKQAALASIERLLEEDSLLPHPVRMVQREPWRVLTHGFETQPETMEKDTTEAIGFLFGEASRTGLAFQEPVGCLMHEARAEERRLVVCLGYPSGPAPESGPLRVETLAGGSHLGTLHRGNYLELGLAHAALFAFARERGFEPSGPVLELYLDDPAECAPEDLRTELMLPVDIDP